MCVCVCCWFSSARFAEVVRPRLHLPQSQLTPAAAVLSTVLAITSSFLMSSIHAVCLELMRCGWLNLDVGVHPSRRIAVVGDRPGRKGIFCITQQVPYYTSLILNTSLSRGTTNEVNTKTFFGASIISTEHGIFSKVS